MIKDWKTYRDMALELAKSGMILVYGDFCPELEEVVHDCIFQVQKLGFKTATLLINSNGGHTDSFAAIRGAMFQSGMEFTGLVLSRARSNGFRLLQLCKTRKSLSDAAFKFHWGYFRLENQDLAALMAGNYRCVDHIIKWQRAVLLDVHNRTGVSVHDLEQFALYEVGFTAEEALLLNFIDEIVSDLPVQIPDMEAELDT